MAWEHVTNVEIETLRFAVPGGWLYRVGTSTVFVPHPTAQGEKVAPTYDDDIRRRDELGAAYARGFADASGRMAPVWDTKLYDNIEALLPKDGVIDDTCSLVNEIMCLIQEREAK